MGRRLGTTIVLLSFLLAIQPGTSAQAVDVGGQLDVSTAALEAILLVKVNESRALAGLPALEVHPWAETVAREHAARMAASGEIWHNQDYMSQGRSAMGATFLGENVGVGGSIDHLHDMLMESAPHRRNILGSEFTHAGIGITLGGGSLYLTEDFARIPGGTAGASAPAPEPAAAAAPARRAPKPAPAPRPDPKPAQPPVQKPAPEPPPAPPVQEQPPAPPEQDVRATVASTGAASKLPAGSAPRHDPGLTLLAVGLVALAGTGAVGLRLRAGPVAG